MALVVALPTCYFIYASKNKPQLTTKTLNISDQDIFEEVKEPVKDAKKEAEGRATGAKNEVVGRASDTKNDIKAQAQGAVKAAQDKYDELTKKK